MFKKLGLFLIFVLIMAQVIALSAPQAKADPGMTSEAQLWDDWYNTFIIKTPKYHYLTRSELASKLPYLRSLGFTVDKNFVWYSHQKTMRASNYSNKEWSYLWYGTLTWQKLGILFEPYVYLHVFKYGDTFISRVCGNFSRQHKSPPPPRISGYKWNDKDGDGKWDSDEPGISNWTIVLRKGGKEVARTKTKSNGYYEFVLDARSKPTGLGVTPGVFTLSEVKPSGWISTRSPGSVTVKAGAPGVNYKGENFGNYKLGKISGYKWEDVNDNGVWDSGEPPLAEWKIILRKPDGSKVSATTGPNGFYRFTGLRYGTHNVSEELKDGWAQTCPDNPDYYSILVKSGTDADNKNFGNFQMGMISGIKWEDMYENGERDNEDKLLPEWKIMLEKPDGSMEETYTDANGYYEFAGLRGGLHKLSEELPEGWVQTHPKDPDHYEIEIQSRSDFREKDFGNFNLGKISGIKWDDGHPPDRNRIDDEPPLADWTIVLTKVTEEGEEIIATNVTDAEGAYKFEGLHQGKYHVWEMLKEDWRQSTPEESHEEPFDLSYGKGCYEVDVVSGTDKREKDFGNVELGTIEKRVFHYWWLEPIQCVIVRLEEIDIPGVLENTPPLPREKHTDENGSALFEDLLPGDYQITIVPPEGWLAEPPELVHEVPLPEGNDAVKDNFIYNNLSGEPRTIGFWKNWRHKYTNAEMAALIERVKAGSHNFEDLSLDTIDAMLDTSGKKPKKRMATIQYLGAWLNLASDRLGFLLCVDLTRVSGWDRIINDDDGLMTIHRLMLQMRELYNDGELNDQEWEIFKDICDELNNSRLFASCTEDLQNEFSQTFEQWPGMIMGVFSASISEGAILASLPADNNDVLQAADSIGDLTIPSDWQAPQSIADFNAAFVPYTSTSMAVDSEGFWHIVYPDRVMYEEEGQNYSKTYIKYIKEGSDPQVLSEALLNTSSGDPWTGELISGPSITLDGCNGIHVTYSHWSSQDTLGDQTIMYMFKEGCCEVDASIRIEPETMNLESKGVITALIKLPDGYDINDINPSTIQCFSAIATKTNTTGNGTMIAKFDREDLVDVPLGDEVVFTVVGCLYDGAHFEGMDIIRVIE